MDNSVLISNIEKLCSKHGIKPNKALVESGAGKDFIYNVRKGQKPSIEKVSQLAAYFNVSTDYLLGNEQKNKTSTEMEGLTDMQKKVWNKIMKLSPDRLEFAEAQIDLLLSHKKNQEK